MPAYKGQMQIVSTYVTLRMRVLIYTGIIKLFLTAIFKVSSFRVMHCTLFLLRSWKKLK